MINRKGQMTMSDLEELKRKIQVLDVVKRAIASLEIIYSNQPMPEEVSAQLESLQDHESILWDEILELSK
jgi:hypothetical protein